MSMQWSIIVCTLHFLAKSFKLYDSLDPPPSRHLVDQLVAKPYVTFSFHNCHIIGYRPYLWMTLIDVNLRCLRSSLQNMTFRRNDLLDHATWRVTRHNCSK